MVTSPQLQEAQSRRATLDEDCGRKGSDYLSSFFESYSKVENQLLHILASPEERWIDENSNETNSIVQPGRVILDKEISPEMEGQIIKDDTAIDGGQFADVFRASWIFPDGSTTQVAVKSIRRRTGVDKERMTKVSMSICILRNHRLG